MNKVKIILITLVIIIVASFVLYGVRMSTIQNQDIQISQPSIEDRSTSDDTTDASKIEDKGREVYDSKNLTSTTWIWKETYLGTGPNADVKNPIIPQKLKAFTLTFTSDGRVNGTTDCNNFSGTYVLENGKIKFGSFMSTLMYCEGSQEQEFISMIKDGTIAYGEDSILLEHEQTVLFEKQR